MADGSQGYRSSLYLISIRATHPEFGFNAIRFSTHIFNTEAEVDFAAKAVQKELSN